MASEAPRNHPPTHLREGSRVVADIEGLGRLDNTVRFVASDEPTGMIHRRTPTGGAR